MINSFRIFFLGCLFLSIISCGSKDSEEETAEILELATIDEFSSLQETKKIDVTANMYWFTETNEGWITISPRFGTNDGVVNITANFNPNNSNRTGSITINGGNLSKTITITQAARAENTGDLDPNNAPFQNFDLSTWKLNTTENNGSGFAKTISVSEMNSGYQDTDYFYTGDDGGLVFKCPISGFKTSANTSYTRVELREMLRGSNTNISTQGVNKNNWVFGTAPESDKNAAAGFDGEMTATLAINKVTTTGSNSHIGRFIIGQIHANDDEPIRAYYRKLIGNTLGSIYFAHEPTDGNGSEQWHEVIGSRSNSAANPADGIALNEKFTYKIKVVGDILTFTIIREGKDDVVKTVDMVNSGFNVGGQYMYFKAGIYQANNTGDADDYAQVTFYKLEKSHSTN